MLVDFFLLLCHCNQYDILIIVPSYAFRLSRIDSRRMGLVASLASAPVAVEVVKGELVREVRKREDAKYGRYQVSKVSKLGSK